MSDSDPSRYEPEERLAEIILAGERIRCAAVAGLISAAVTMVSALVSIELAGLSASALVEAAVVAVLSVGVWQKSRAAALLLFGCFTALRLYEFARYGSGLFSGLAFGYLFLLGVRGTFRLSGARPDLL